MRMSPPSYAVALRERERAGLRVVEQEQARQATRDVVLGLAVRMRVVPQGRGRLVDRPRGRPGRSRSDQLVRAAVGLRGQVHPVPVQGGGLRQGVGDVDPDLVAEAGAQRWPEVGAVDAPRLGGLARQELAAARLEPQVEHLGAGGVDVRLQQRRDLQLIGEIELAQVAGVRPGPDQADHAGQPEHAEQAEDQEDRQRPDEWAAPAAGRSGTGRVLDRSVRHHGTTLPPREGGDIGKCPPRSPIRSARSQGHP